MRTTRLLLALLLVLAARSVAAQQQIVNSSFDSDLSSWSLSVFTIPTGTANQIASLDTRSGVAHLANGGAAGTIELQQCVLLPDTGVAYNWGTWAYVPAATNGLAHVQLYWCNSASCTVCNHSVAAVDSSATDTWQHLQVAGSPVGSGETYGKLVLRGTANAASAADFYFDGAYLGPGITPATLQRFSAE